jgi:hypothetical protein
MLLLDSVQESKATLCQDTDKASLWSPGLVKRI